MVKNSQKAKKPSVTSERVPISSKPSNLDCRDSGELFDAHIVAVCKIFEKGRGFCRAPCLAVGLLYTCILQGARQAQGPCCTNPSCDLLNGLTLGRFSVGADSTVWRVNRRGPVAPVDPCKALKPCRGTLELPVTNWRSLALISSEYPSTISQNHLTTGVSAVQYFSRVLERQSTMSILPIPPENK